jgi:hypothetical protein
MTFQLIETKTLGSSASAIEFTSIPQDGTDLFVLFSIRDNRAVPANGFLLSVNGSTANSASGKYLYGSGSAASSLTLSAEQHVQGDSSTSNTFCNGSFTLTNYTASGVSKSFSIDAVTENNATEAYTGLFAGVWTGTAAITSLGFVMDSSFGGNAFLTGSSMSLYKISKGTSNGVVVS